MATIPDKVNTGALATVVAVGAISMIGISTALTAMVRAEQDAHALEKGTTANLRPRTELAAEQLKELEQGTHWTDRAHGKVAIPIERAMQLVVADISKNPNAATDPPPPDAGAAAHPAPAEGSEAGATEGDAGAPAAEGADAEPTQGPEPGSKGTEPTQGPEQGTPSDFPTHDPASKGHSPKAPRAPEPQPAAPDPGSP